MLILSFLFSKQVLLGMLLGACLFVPWNQRRTYFCLRLVLSVAALMAVSGFIDNSPALTWTRLLLNTLLIYLQILVCFDCSLLHAVFYTTCALCRTAYHQQVGLYACVLAAADTGLDEFLCHSPAFAAV